MASLDQGAQHRSGWSKRQGTEIKSLHRELIVDINDPDANHIVVEAEFVAQSTNQGIYNVKLVARQNDGLLVSYLFVFELEVRGLQALDPKTPKPQKVRKANLRKMNIKIIQRGTHSI
jgi:hypothetical protein